MLDASRAIPRNTQEKGKKNERKNMAFLLYTQKGMFDGRRGLASSPQVCKVPRAAFAVAAVTLAMRDMTRGSGYSQLEKILEVTERKNSEAHVSKAPFLKSPDLVVVNFAHPAWLVESLFPTGSVGEGVGGGPGLGPGSVSESDKKEGFGAFVSECLSELFARFLRDNDDDDEDEDDMACLPDVDAYLWSWSALLKEDPPCVILDTYTNGVINASVAVLPAGLPAGLHEVDGHAVACLFIELAGSNCTYSWLRQQGLQTLPGKHTRGGPESVMAWSLGSPREAKANPWSVMADCFALVNFHVSIVCGRPDDNGFRKAWAPVTVQCMFWAHRQVFRLHRFPWGVFLAQPFPNCCGTCGKLEHPGSSGTRCV
jgi:hypothetical protein